MAEVRPIDANALIARYTEIKEKPDTGLVDALFLDGAMAVVDGAPTLGYAPVRHGEWELWEDDSEAEAWLQCSECGRKVALDYDEGYTGYNVPALTKHYPYCHCGAKMDGGESDD